VTVLAIAATFAGGGLGASLRYAIGHFVGERYDGEFPLGTTLINISGCFAAGFLASRFSTSHAGTAIAISFALTGFVGAYTTFSTYAVEGMLLYRDGRHALAVVSLAGTVIAGLLAAGIGAAMAGVAA